MRIDQQNANGASTEASRGAHSTERIAGAPRGNGLAGPEAPADRVDVSRAGRLLEMALRSDESQRNQKVAVLAELFRSGNLPVDPEAIADAILREDQPDPAIQP